MKKNPRWVQIAGLGFIAGLALYGALRTLFPSPVPATRPSTPQPAAVVAPGRVTMIELGSAACIPCKMMAPIIAELKKEYAGRADILSIDVREYPDTVQKYDIRAIPTQIFFDASGREVQRHTGFMDKERIVAVLTRLGVS
jgi:thioredoxin 1